MGCLYVYKYIYMQQAISKRKDGMTLRGNGEVTWERLEGRGRGCSYILVKKHSLLSSKNSHIFLTSAPAPGLAIAVS